MIALFHQTKTPISFWCKWGLNRRSFIQPSKTLPVELTGTHSRDILYFSIKNTILVHGSHNLISSLTMDHFNLVIFFNNLNNLYI